MIWSAILIQAKGSQRSSQPATKTPIAPMRSLTLVKVPRRIVCRVMIPKKIDHVQPGHPRSGLTCSVMRGFFPSHATTLGCLWVA